MLGPNDLVLCGGSLQYVPLFDRLAATSGAGFAGISLFAVDCERLMAKGTPLSEIRKRIEDHGLAITDLEIIGRWLPEQVKAPPGMSGGMAALLTRLTPEAMLPMATELGAPVVTIGELFNLRYDADRLADGFGKTCDLYAPHGISVAIEFVATAGVRTLAQAWEVVRRAGRANGGLVIDSWHVFRSGSTLGELAAIPGSAIKSVQINDAPATASGDLDREMVHGRMLPGAGDLDIAGVIRTLDAIGSQAPIGVEVFSDELFALPAAEAARRCAQSARAVLAQARSIES